MLENILSLNILKLLSMGNARTYRKLKDRLTAVEENISLLILKPYQKSLLRTGYLQPIREMNWLATQNLRLHNVTNVAIIILSAILPVVIYFDAPDKKTVDIASGWNAIKMWALILSALLAIMNALRQSYKFREKWQNYFRTIELLLVEGEQFFALAGSYRLFSVHADAFSTFIANIGALKLDEVSDFIKVSAPDTDASIQSNIAQQMRQQSGQQKRVATSINAIDEEINQFVKSDQKISYHKVDHDRKLITLYVNDPSYQPPAESFSFKDPTLTDLSYKLAVKEGTLVAQRAVGAGSPVQSAEIAGDVAGSIGCVCYHDNGRSIFITCYHVVKPPQQAWESFDPANDHAGVKGEDNKIIGNIIDGEKNLLYDVALIKPDKDLPYDTLIDGSLQLVGPAYIDSNNYTAYSDVFILSRIRGYRKIKGLLAGVNKPVTVNYGTPLNPNWMDMAGLHQIFSVSTEPFSKEGDSGSIVFTEDGLAVGMIVAGNNADVSYAIPFIDIQNRFNLQLKTPQKP